MAKTTVVQVSDDLDGSKDAQTVRFSFQGADYEIDLAKKNLAAFEKALKPYLDVATKAPRSSRRSTSKRSSSSVDLAAVRAWAKENGINVSERGRVASSVIDQYKQAQG